MSIPTTTTGDDATNNNINAITPSMGLLGVFDGHGAEDITTNLRSKLHSQREWAEAYHTCGANYKPLTSACYRVWRGGLPSLGDEDLGERWAYVSCECWRLLAKILLCMHGLDKIQDGS